VYRERKDNNWFVLVKSSSFPRGVALIMQPPAISVMQYVRFTRTTLISTTNRSTITTLPSHHHPSCRPTQTCSGSSRRKNLNGTYSISKSLTLHMKHRLGHEDTERTTYLQEDTSCHPSRPVVRTSTTGSRGQSRGLRGCAIRNPSRFCPLWIFVRTCCNYVRGS
jgi:hypothetical protein